MGEVQLIACQRQFGKHENLCQLSRCEACKSNVLFEVCADVAPRWDRLRGGYRTSACHADKLAWRTHECHAGRLPSRPVADGGRRRKGDASQVAKRSEIYPLNILAASAIAFRGVKGMLGVVEGLVSLGASTIPGEYILPRLVASFRKLYPSVRVGIRIGDTEKVASDVAAGRLEIGVVGSKTAGGGLRHVALWEDELVVVVPAGHRWAGRRRLPLDELVKEPFLSRESGSGTRIVMEAALKKAARGPCALSVVAELGSTSAVKTGILNGLGVSILSARAVETEVASGLMATARLTGASIRRSIFMVYRTHRTPSPACERLVRFLKESAL